MPLMPDLADWTYSGDPATSDRDEVRFWLQDTDPAVRLLSNTEIDWLIATWVPKFDSLVYAAAKAAEVVSVKFAGVVTVSADGVAVNVADISDRYAAAAARLEQIHKDHQVGGEIDIRNLLWDSTLDWGIAPLVFGVGLHDNPEAGQQNYGGERLQGAAWAEAAERSGWYG